MRTLSASLVLVAALLVPHRMDASTIALTLIDSGSGEVGFSFGLNRFEMSAEFPDLFFDGNLFEPFLDGTIDIVSGPLSTLQIIDPEHSRYVYGPGTVTIAAQWTNLKGLQVNGTFVATLLDLMVDVCEGCDSVFPGASYGDVVATLADGRFDRKLAHLLRVERRGAGGAFFFGPDGIDGDPASFDRIGGSHTGEASLELFAAAAPVPEPSLLILSLSASGLALARRCRRATAPTRA